MSETTKRSKQAKKAPTEIKINASFSGPAKDNLIELASRFGIEEKHATDLLIVGLVIIDVATRSEGLKLSIESDKEKTVINLKELADDVSKRFGHKN